VIRGARRALALFWLVSSPSWALEPVRLRLSASAPLPAAVAPALPLLPGTAIPSAMAAPVLSAPPVVAPELASPSGLYILSRTFDRPVELSPRAQVGHYAVEAAIQSAKIAAAYWLAGWPGAASAGLLTLWHYPLSVGYQSLGHLSYKQTRDRSRFLRELAGNPDVEGLKVVTGSQVHFRGPLAHRQTSHGLVIVEASRPPSFPDASALPVSDPAKTWFRLKLSILGEEHSLEWRPTLADALARRTPPEAVARAWREFVARAGWWRRYFGAAARETLIAVALVGENGEERELGVIARGRPAVKLASGRSALPLADVRVVSKPTRRAPWRWLDALLGREIVRP